MANAIRVLSQDDLMKIAKAVHPKADSASWNMLAGCGEASLKKQANAITETFISALDIAEEDGRSEVTYEDIDAAVSFAFPSSEPPAVTRPAPPKTPPAAVSLHPRCKVIAEQPPTVRRGDAPALSKSFSIPRRATSPAPLVT